MAARNPTYNEFMLATRMLDIRNRLFCGVIVMLLLGGAVSAPPVRAHDGASPAGGRPQVFRAAVQDAGVALPAGGRPQVPIVPQQTGFRAAVQDAGVALPAAPSANYPPDPTADNGWSSGLAGVADIQSAFNQARTTENSQLGTSLPALSLPAQAQWSALSDGARATWLINHERTDRGVMPMQGEESHVTGVAQTFAQYLLSHDAFDHNADGRDPWTRIYAEPTIGACHDNLNVAENLAVFATTGNSIPLGVERAIYMWLYFDSGSGWGHRHTALWYPYNDNSGPLGKEGFLGLGRAAGGPYQGPFTQSYPRAELIVLDVFDPCPTWNYTIYNLFLPLLKR